MGTLLVAAMLVLFYLCITRSAVRSYTGQGFQPCIYPELARTDAVKFRPGTYTAGRVVGQMTTLTAASDVQTLTFGGTPTGGTFRLSFNGVETANITFDTTAGGAPLAANIKAALEALPQIGAGNTSVSSSLTVPAVTFTNDLANRWQPLLVNTVNQMTSGTAATLTIAHTTPGRGVAGEWANYDDTQSDGTDIARGVLQYNVTVTPDGRHYFTDPVGGSASYWSAPIWIKGYFRTADLTGLDVNGVNDMGRIKEGAIGNLTSVATVIYIN